MKSILTEAVLGLFDSYCSVFDLKSKSNFDSKGRKRTVTAAQQKREKVKRKNKRR